MCYVNTICWITICIPANYTLTIIWQNGKLKRSYCLIELSNSSVPLKQRHFLNDEMIFYGGNFTMSVIRSHKKNILISANPRKFLIGILAISLLMTVFLSGIFFSTSAAIVPDTVFYPRDYWSAPF